MNPLAVIQERLLDLRKLGVRKIGVFGSYSNGTAKADSDVDVYIEFDDRYRTFDNFFAVIELLESVLRTRVDLVTDKSLTETKARLILPTVRYVS